MAGASRLPRLSPLDRRILALAFPALGALLVEPLYNLVDSAIVGHLGPVPLGSLAVATAALNLLGWTAGFLEMATVSAIARARGANDEPSAARAAGAAYVVSIALGLSVMGALELAAPLLAHLLGGHGAGPVEHGAVTYLRIAAVGMPMLLFGLAGNAHLTGLADTRTPLRIVLVANLVNVVLELVLVYGAHTGLAGSAAGTVAAQAVAAALFARVARRSPLRPRRPARRDVSTLLGSGVSLSIRTIALGAVLLAATAIAGRLGTAPLGGHQIAFQVWTLLALALDSLAVPAQVFVSEALGAADREHARAVGRRVIVLGLAAGACVAALTLASAWNLPAVFSPSRAVDHQATLALVLCAAQQPLGALAFVFDGLLLGAGEYAALRRSMILAACVFVPFGALALEAPGVGITAIWAGLGCWLAARAVLLAGRWRAIVARA